VLRGGVWYTASRLVPQFYTLAISIVAARFLGPEGMGRQSFIAFAELSLVALLSNGMFFALMRWVGETVGRRQAAALGAVLRWAWAATTALALAGTGILVAAALLGADPRSAWLLAALVCFMGTLHAVPTAVLIGLQRWRQASLVGLITGLVATAAVIVVLAAGGGITGMFAVEAVISVANLAWTSTLARRALSLDESRIEPSFDLRGAVARTALVLTVSEVLALVVERRSEVFFLAQFSGDTQIALYSIVFSVVSAFLQLPYAMAAAISPAVATLFGAGDLERIRSGYSRALRLLLTGAAPLTAVGLSLGPALVRLIYGSEYRGTRSVLLVMMSVFPVMAAGTVANALLTGVGRLRALLTASAVAATVDLGLAAALVPGHDAVGAAIANVGAQLVLTVTLLVAARNTLGKIRWNLSLLLRGAVGASLAGLAAWGAVSALGDAAGVLVGMFLALGVYAAVGMTLKVLAADDSSWLDNTVGHYFGGRVGKFARVLAAAP
jgi:O-antigen/teichoic acid export membrane protein